MARFSIRGLLLAVAFVAVASAALKHANSAWWIVSSALASLLFLSATIVAIAGSGSHRAKAAAFVAFLLVYAVVVRIPFDSDFPVYFPMRDAVRYAYEKIESRTYYDPETGEELDMVREGRIELSDATTWGAFHVQSYPDEYAFQLIAHSLLAILFGFLGSAFAGFVYRRSHPEDKTDAA